jgi:hypothetical protein
MGASCWGCAFGVTPLPIPGTVTETADALGHCWQCSVFVCARHGELDRGSGKWLCTKCVAALAAGNQPKVKSPSTQVARLTSSTDFKRRFPFTFQASEPERKRLRRKAKVAIPRSATQRGNEQLRTDAVGTVMFLRRSSEASNAAALSAAVALPDHLQRLVKNYESKPRVQTLPRQLTRTRVRAASSRQAPPSRQTSGSRALRIRGR